MPRTIVSAFVVWFASALLQAQAQAPPPSSPSVVKPAETRGPAFSFDRIHTRVRFEDDGSGRREQTLWIKVLDEQGVRRFGEFPLVYQSESEDLSVTEIAVEKPDGTLVPTPATSVQDLAVTLPGRLPVYVDLRQKVASVTALRPGDVLRIAAVWTIKKPIAPGQFWFEYSFDDTNAVKDEQLEIDLPAARAVALKTAAAAPAEEHGGAGAVSDGRRIYRWKTSHPEAAAEPKKLQPGDEAEPADVRLSSFRTWDEFARWFTPLASPAADATVKAKADELTAGAADRAAKIAAIYRFVSTEIRYVSLSFGLGRYSAHAPAEVLRTQYGDCKDKAVLIRALLDAVGVRVVPVLVNTTRSVDADFASPLEFNHMVALAPAAASLDGTWMDATIEVAPLGMLGLVTRDRRALALPGDGRGAVVRTPADPPVPAFTDITVDGRVNAIGVLEAKVTATMRGDAEVLARMFARTASRAALKEFATGFATVNAIDGDISETVTSDPADTRDPFRLTFSVRKRGFLDWAATRSDLRVPPGQSLRYATARDRKDLRRIYLGSPGVLHLRATIELPPGYEASAPQPVSTSRVGLTYASTYRVDGRRLIVERDVTLGARTIPSSGFGEYEALADAVQVDVGQPFTVRNSVTGMPAIPPDATAEELYKAGRSAYDADRYDAAVAIYKRTTELAPKMADAWNALGLAYEELGRREEAVAAIRKQIEIDPYSKDAYEDLGRILDDAGKPDEAIKAYTRQTELNPLDGRGFKALGALYVEGNRSADAIPVLEKGASLLPRDGWVLANLARAYLDTKQIDKSRQTVDRLMDLAPSAAVRQYVARQLALNGVDLVRAEGLARGAELDLVDGLNRAGAASVTDDTLDLVERLGWAWDAIAWIDFQRGRLAEADAYARASWQLLGASEVADHLGQICEKRGKLADALNYYVTAQAFDPAPSAGLVARVKKLIGGGDLPRMLEYARQTANVGRSFAVDATGLSGTARFLVIVDNTRKPIEMRFVGGDQALKPLADAPLRSALMPVLFPTDAPARLPLGVTVMCRPAGGCRGGVHLPTQVSDGWLRADSK